MERGQCEAEKLRGKQALPMRRSTNKASILGEGLGLGVDACLGGALHTSPNPTSQGHR